MIIHPVPAVKTYVIVWLALMSLLGFTLGSAYVNLGWLNSVLNIGIAIAKSLLVMLFFMHLRSSHTVLRVFAAAGFFWLALLIGLAMTDFATR